MDILKGWNRTQLDPYMKWLLQLGEEMIYYDLYF